MTDHDPLAKRSHSLEELAIRLARDDVSVRLIAHEIELVEGGQPEVIALALSYLFRQRDSAGDQPVESAVETAIGAMSMVLRRLT